MTGRQRHASSSPRERGQTTQDFAIGIGVFLLAIAFVFAFVPTVITPFSGAPGGDAPQAERIAADVLDETATGSTPNQIDATAFDGLDASDADELGLRSTASGPIDHVNVTVVELSDADQEPIMVDIDGDGTDEPLREGPAYDDQSAAVVSRLVTVVDDGDPVSECEDSACRLVVRVW
ncbi:DUF7287 family protein [Salinilacihabitans rarus]|uniref:DUF7287 family protein n=1 Tax=Salinilacihabitans rarus TaxID=2961596 RepID=UPI0020C88B3D|nr:hypothetical protein [Salinilacihabitans rarus]